MPPAATSVNLLPPEMQAESLLFGGIRQGHRDVAEVRNDGHFAAARLMIESGPAAFGIRRSVTAAPGGRLPARLPPTQSLCPPGTPACLLWSRRSRH